MKSASAPLLALLHSGSDFEMADLWTLTLSGGQVIRWSGADIPLSWGGQDYALGPVLTRSRISEKKGVIVSSLEVSIHANESDTVNGTPLIPFIRRRGLDGAVIRLDRAFLPLWGDPVTGTVLRFSGKVTSIGGIEGNSARITVSSWMILLNVNTPPNLYQTSCLNTVYDSKCGLDRDDWRVSTTISATSTASVLKTGASDPDGWFAQGEVLVTSGPASGVRRTIRSSLSDGTVTLVQPLPAVPAIGNTVELLPGCDLGKGTCETKFNNLLRHRGCPFVPVPETAV